MELENKHLEFLIKLIIRGTYHRNAKLRSTHKKRSYTKNQFEDSIVNSFIGFLSEAAFSFHAEPVVEEGCLLEGGWFLTPRREHSLTGPKSVYITITTQPLARFEPFYERLAFSLENTLFAAVKKEGFNLAALEESEFKTLKVDEVFDFFEFVSGEFKPTEPRKFFNLFKNLSKEERKKRNREQKNEVGPKTREALWNLVGSICAFQIDHEAWILNRLFIDRFFSPLYRKGNISDIDTVIDHQDYFSVLDVKSKGPFKTKKNPNDRYGINFNKLNFYRGIDAVDRATSYYLVNPKEPRNLTPSTPPESWKVATMKRFSKEGEPHDGGGTGRNSDRNPRTMTLRVEKFDDFFKCSE